MSGKILDRSRLDRVRSKEVVLFSFPSALVHYSVPMSGKVTEKKVAKKGLSDSASTQDGEMRSAVRSSDRECRCEELGVAVTDKDG